ncbi:MAG: rhodanese-like domain-containing protein [Deltaproteobacteria bacterium]|nr:rhodanese-like domain-containing protein [Deltaproteobacteria bacterium]
MTALARLIPASLGLLLLGSLLGLGNHALRFEGLFPAPAEAAAACGEGTTGAPVLQSAEEAGTLCAGGHILILDVRDAETFARGHVAGAVHLPCSVGKIEAEIEGQLMGSETVLVYGADTESALPVASSLLLRGIHDVRVIDGGYPAWEAASLACASGPCAACGAGHEGGPSHEGHDHE